MRPPTELTDEIGDQIRETGDTELLLVDHGALVGLIVLRCVTHNGFPELAALVLTCLMS